MQNKILTAMIVLNLLVMVAAVISMCCFYADPMIFTNPPTGAI